MDSLKKELNKEVIERPSKDVIDKQRVDTIQWLTEQGFIPLNESIKNALIGFLVETKLGIREKGLFFIGGVGTGKTVALKVIHIARNYKFFESYNITENSKGFDSSRDYIRDLLTKYQIEEKNHVIIDDFGDELTINNYGIKSEFMAEVMRDRHKTFIERGDLTLISSNLGRDELEARYTKRIISRITQMCEVVICNGEDLRCK